MSAPTSVHLTADLASDGSKVQLIRYDLMTAEILEVVADLSRADARVLGRRLYNESRRPAEGDPAAGCNRCGPRRDDPGVQAAGMRCTSCANVPALPVGQVRRSTDGLTVVCVAPDVWKVVGDDPEHIAFHGWRADRHVGDWAVAGSLSDLRAVTS